MPTPRAAGSSLTVHESLADIPASDWDALVTYDSPFVSHAFLRLLETSGSVGADATGWMPQYIVAREGERVVGALPAYLRGDSYGEYIFDWSWAQAAQRAGLPYYPKVTVAVPFTPATGARILLHPAVDHARTRALLLDGLLQLTAKTDSSSAHVLFCLEDEAQALADAGFIRRSTHQYHWRNDGYSTFDDFLATLRHENRKQIKKERRRVAEQGVIIERLAGDRASERDWALMYELYRSTTDRKWGSPYLTKHFFTQARDAVGDRALLTLARRGDNVIAGTLSFQAGKHLFGRYWGAREQVDSLHFELCYYQLIEHAIVTGKTLVEAGAQGDHKLKRGFVPVVVHSAHHIEDARLRAAVARACDDEARQLRALLPEWATHAPFREGAEPKYPQSAGIAIAGGAVREVGDDAPSRDHG